MILKMCKPIEYLQTSHSKAFSGILPEDAVGGDFFWGEAGLITMDFTDPGGGESPPQ